MSMYQLKECLSHMIKNETDGLYATTLEPNQTGLSAYVVFNCYGLIGVEAKRFLIPHKHRKMIIEVAKDMGEAAETRCKRFNWDEMIPVEVSDFPHILLRGSELKRARSVLSQQEWSNVFNFIAGNANAIKKYWLNGDSFELFEAFDFIHDDIRNK